MNLLKILLTALLVNNIHFIEIKASDKDAAILNSVNIKEYEKINKLYDICWNGEAIFEPSQKRTSIDILRSKYEEISNPIFFKNFIEQELKYKSWMVNIISKKLYKNGSKTKELQYIERNILNEIEVLDISFQDDNPIHLNQRERFLKILFERTAFSRKEIFLQNFIDAGEKYSDIKKYLRSDPYFKQKRKCVFDYGQTYSTSQISEKKKLLSQKNDFFSHAFSDVFKVMSFHYHLISICFPDTFFILLKEGPSTVFICEKALDEAEFLSLSFKMLNNKKDKVAYETNSKFFTKDNKTEKYNCRKFQTEEDANLLTNDLIEKMKIESCYFSEIVRDFIESNSFRADNTNFSDLAISKKKLNIEKAVHEKILSLENEPAIKHKLFFENYHLLRKQNLIDIVSEGLQKTPSLLKIKSFKVHPLEMTIKQNINKFLESDQILWHILSESTDDNLNQSLKKAYESFEKTSPDIFYDLQAKYQYRFFVLEHYYPGKINSAKKRLLSELKQKNLAKEKAEAERDRLIQELLDTDTKKKKKKKENKKNTKPKLIKEEPIKTSAVPAVKKAESLQVKNDQKKQPLQPAKNNKQVISPKKPGNQNKPKHIQKEQKKGHPKKEEQKNIPQPNIIIVSDNKKLEQDSLEVSKTESQPKKKKRKKKKNTLQSNIIIIPDTQKVENDSLNKQEILFEDEKDAEQNQKEINNLTSKLEDILNINQYLQDEINLKREECVYLEQENTYIKAQTKQILNYLKYIQNLKKEQKNSLYNEFRNIKKFIAENDAEQLALEDSQNLVEQANLLSHGSYDVFYQGINLMNHLLVERVSLIEEIKALIVEKNQLIELISSHKKNKDPIFQNNTNYEEKTPSQKSESFFSKAKKKTEALKKTIEGVSTFLKSGNVRDFGANILRSRLQSLLTDNKKLTTTLRAQLEYTDKKIPKLIQKNIHIKNYLFDIQQKYSAVMASFHEESYEYPIKVQSFYEKQILKRVSTHAKRQEFWGSVNYFHQVNSDFAVKMGALDKDIQELYANLNRLSYQKDVYHSQIQELQDRLAREE